MGLSDAVDDVMDFVEVGVLATRAVGGVGKHGDARPLIGVFNKSGGGVLDDGVELLLGGLLVDTAVSKSVKLIGFLADEGTGEIVGL